MVINSLEASGVVISVAGSIPVLTAIKDKMNIKELFKKIDKSFICHYLFLTGVGIMTIILQYIIVKNVMIFLI